MAYVPVPKDLSKIKTTLMENRKRNVHLHVMVTPDELAAIHERMTEAGISNAGAYVRKMALNGYILHIDLTPVKELISLQRRCSNNLNQVAVTCVTSVPHKMVTASGFRTQSRRQRVHRSATGWQ